MDRANYLSMLQTAIEEARRGLAEGGIPIGAAVFDRDGRLLGSGHNRRVQDGDPSAHGETDAFRKAGRQKSYRDKMMVTTLAPCWYCSGLIRQFGI
jgi:cytosine/creatinine deaminase